MRLQMSRSQAFQSLNARVVEPRRSLEPFDQRLTGILGPRLHRLGDRRPRNGIRQDRQHDHEQIAIQLVHIDPLRRLSPNS